MAKLDILICGSGIAGPALAYWLAQARVDVSITIMERASTPRTTGQAVDIRGSAVDVMRKMGIEDKVRSMNTTEKGMCHVDSHGKAFASFPATGSTEVQGFTSEFEIQRGDLSKILFDIVNGQATWVYGEYVTKIEQQEDSSGRVRVEYANGRSPEMFDLVVGADGLNSKTRKLTFHPQNNGEDYLYHLGQIFVLFTIPQLETEDHWARWYGMVGGRTVCLRPDNQGRTAVILMASGDDTSKIISAAEEGNDKLKATLKEEFHDGGWIVSQVLDGMDQATDFYYTRIAQVKMPDFVEGRVALLGDAGYCPSPISGQGTSAALIGAYILAGEITESPDDIPTALKRYQSTMKPQIKEMQHLIPGARKIFAPASQIGLSLRNIVFRTLALKPVLKFTYGLMQGGSKESWEPPRYQRLVST